MKMGKKQDFLPNADVASDLLSSPLLDLDEIDRRDIHFLVQAIRSKLAERPPHRRQAFFWALFHKLAIELDDLQPVEAQP
jgi:hypothetical protein